MKSVLISIKPKWCELIASGKKTVEVRKTKPKIETPFKVYIYCTQGEPLMKTAGNKCFIDNSYVEGENLYGLYELVNSKVIGEFVCDKVVQFENHCYNPAFEETADLSCVGFEGLYYYLGLNDYGYGWHISDLVIYDKPKELSEFYQEGKNGEKFYYDYCAGCPHHETPVGDDPCNGCDGNRNYFYRPPQSWCYVEEVDIKCL